MECCVAYLKALVSDLGIPWQPLYYAITCVIDFRDHYSLGSHLYICTLFAASRSFCDSSIRVRPSWNTLSCYLRLHYCHRMDSQKMYKVYGGTTDVRKFVARVELEAALKNHVDEKKAQYIASKLVGHAMDV